MPKEKRSMLEWRPAPEPLVRRFEAAAQTLPAVTVRKRFGYPAAFLNGHMFAGVFQDWPVHLDPRRT